jgi:4-aminobutyrate aminotransferase
LQLLFDQVITPDQVAAMIIEPILGEGGYVIPPKGFLSTLRSIAAKHGILFIADEIQTGFGRTGKMFAVEHFDVVPDIMLMAKGIANGMPLSAFIADKELTQHWKPARHGSTFGGNPVCCAAALATLDVISEEHLVERAAVMGEKMLKHLKSFAKGKSHIGEVRGLGLMIGIDFNDENGMPGKKVAELVAQRCFENKLLVLTCGSYSHVIRLIPALNASNDEIEQGLEILEKSMTI